MLAAVALSFSGFTALCLSMEKHYIELLKHKPSAARRRVLRWGGWALLLLSSWVAVKNAGWAMGLVHVTAVYMMTAVVLVWMLPYQPRLALILAALGLLVGPLNLSGLF